MNIKALIKKYEAVECVVGIVSGKTILKTVLRDLKQLDEPQPVKVPQVVADMIEGARGQSVELEDAFEYAQEVATIEFREWFRKLENRNNFARAWLDGYEVEKEKRYRVKIKNVYHGDLGRAAPFEQFSFYTRERNRSGIRYEFTRKELKDADFGWVFDCPGIEIEEVE